MLVESVHTHRAQYLHALFSLVLKFSTFHLLALAVHWQPIILHHELSSPNRLFYFNSKSNWGKRAEGRISLEESVWLDGKNVNCVLKETTWNLGKMNHLHFFVEPFFVQQNWKHKCRRRKGNTLLKSVASVCKISTCLVYVSFSHFHDFLFHFVLFQLGISCNQGRIVEDLCLGFVFCTFSFYLSLSFALTLTLLKIYSINCVHIAVWLMLNAQNRVFLLPFLVLLRYIYEYAACVRGKIATRTKKAMYGIKTQLGYVIFSFW